MANERRLIDSVELIDKLPIVKDDKQVSLIGAVADVVTMVSECTPLDAVEVRCKDCKYSVVPKCQKAYCKEKGILKCDKPGGIAFNRRVYSTDFCSYGKKETDGNEG